MSSGAGQQYLSQLDAVDSDQASSTGTYNVGSYSADGVTYAHAIALNSGCDNGDGGDFWVDYNISRAWREFTVTVAISDKSSAASTVTFKLIGDGNTLTTSALKLGTATRVKIPVDRILRLRLFINDPNAPKRSCGFERIRTTVIVGDPALTQ